MIRDDIKKAIIDAMKSKDVNAKNILGVVKNLSIKRRNTKI